MDDSTEDRYQKMKTVAENYKVNTKERESDTARRDAEVYQPRVWGI